MKENNDKKEELHGEQFDKGGWEEQRKKLVEEAETQNQEKYYDDAPAPEEEKVEETVVVGELEDEVIRLGCEGDKPAFLNQAAANWAVRVYENGNSEIERSLRNEEFEIKQELIDLYQLLTDSLLYAPTNDEVIKYIAETIIEVADEEDDEDDKVNVQVKQEDELTKEELDEWQDKNKPLPSSDGDEGKNKPELNQENFLDEDGNLI